MKANPPARIKRKAEKKRLEEEEAKRLRRADENQSAIDPTTGQFIPPNQQQSQNPEIQQPEVNAEEVKTEIKTESNGESGKMNGVVKENGDCEDDKDNENKLKIMLSGFVKSEEEELTDLVKGLGMELTNSAKEATHLVMPKLGRTISFLCAISYVKYILKPEWIRDSSKEKKVLGKDFHTISFSRIFRGVANFLIYLSFHFPEFFGFSYLCVFIQFLIHFRIFSLFSRFFYLFQM